MYGAAAAMDGANTTAMRSKRSSSQNLAFWAGKTRDSVNLIPAVDFAPELTPRITFELG